jgi:bifunctional non-homologous end joining protein LigD
VVPLARRDDWDDVKGFARRFAERMASDHPKQFVAKSAKVARRGKIYVDYLRNGRGATAVAAYSPRSRAGATVATPIAWDELTPKLKPQEFTIQTVPERLTSLDEDPWAAMSDVRQSLTAKAKKTIAL